MEDLETLLNNIECLYLSASESEKPKILMEFNWQLQLLEWGIQRGKQLSKGASA